MASAQRVTTQVYQLPANDEARTRFVNGVKALAEECGAEWVAGSVHNEMDYADLLAAELAERDGDQAVEHIRQRFERG